MIDNCVIIRSKGRRSRSSLTCLDLKFIFQLPFGASSEMSILYREIWIKLGRPGHLCHPSVGLVHSGLDLLPLLLVQVTGWHFVGSPSLQGFGLNHPVVLLKLQGSGCPLRFVKTEAASGFPWVARSAQRPFWLMVPTGLYLGTSAYPFFHSPVGYHFIHIAYWMCVGFCLFVFLSLFFYCRGKLEQWHFYLHTAVIPMAIRLHMFWNLHSDASDKHHFSALTSRCCGMNSCSVNSPDLCFAITCSFLPCFHHSWSTQGWWRVVLKPSGEISEVSGRSLIPGWPFW